MVTFCLSQDLLIASFHSCTPANGTRDASAIVSTIVGARSLLISIAIDSGSIAEVNGALLRNHTSFFRPYLASRIKTIGGTGNGSDCVFPFIYQGSSFSTCIYRTETIGSMRSFALFCSTTANLDQQGLWGYCLGTRALSLLASYHYVRLHDHRL